jgi:glutamine synthetase
VHQYGDLLRMSVSGANNDHRLGANEAPPAIMSVFLGSALDEVFHKLAAGTTAAAKKQTPIEIGVSILPPLKRHSEDRNRTSPFAFTGNKFEFRAVGSSQNVARSTTVLNAIVAESLDYLAGQLEDALKSKKDFNAAVHDIVCKTVKEHQPVLFNGNCYSEDWKKEAKKRGLANLVTTAECLPLINSKKSLDLFGKYRILSKSEADSRHEIYAENYIKTIHIEAETAIEIAATMVLPSVLKYKGVLLPTATTKLQKELVHDLDALIDSLIEKLGKLKKVMGSVPEHSVQQTAEYYCLTVIPSMLALRETVDTLETMTDDELWSMPTYTEMLFAR